MILIAAMTRDRVIGRDGRMPWHIPEDLKLFKRLTTGHTVVMGRRTFRSIGRPLPERYNVVISRSLREAAGALLCRSLEEGLEKARAYGREVFVIGGASIYRQTLPLADKLVISWVKEAYEGDTRFPDFDEKEWQIESRDDYQDFTQVTYLRRESQPGAER